MNVRPEDLSFQDFYRILIHSVAPRPIAWVSTLSPEGQPNLAPFSFFNVVSAIPPMLGFSPAFRPVEGGAAPKDTLHNIRETGEFVVNIVTWELAEAMNLTSGEYAAAVNEFELAKVTPRVSQIVKPPQVAESPVNFECKLHQILEFSRQPRGSSLVIGQIVSVSLAENILKEGRLDGRLLDLIGRMGGLAYTRTTERFEMVRPKPGPQP
jgi:flavin reductase (DIM6/NTAB) family NADH-FMN oxidoreductase RutF